MTDEIIKGLQSIKVFLLYSDFNSLEEQTKVQCSVLGNAIDTMRKYQKIEEIVNTWRHDITAGDYHCMAEVVEDDNT